MKYDYLIVGSGLFGAVFARQMTDAGAKYAAAKQIAKNAQEYAKENMRTQNAIDRYKQTILKITGVTV